MKTRVIIIQVVILTALITFFKVAMPRIEAARQESRLKAREEAIGNFFQSATMEVGGATNAAAARRLRVSPDVHEVQRELGAPDQNMTDFAGAQHLTWLGTKQKLQASFGKGKLYALTLSDLADEHGEQVYETSAQWQKF